ncbi:hypothetical protein WH221_00830 [Chryseobacterium culicis]|nr:hypothetical protein [Chryseobacterium culicis]
MIRVKVAEPFPFPLLYHLSYIPFTTGMAGVEPASEGVTEV